MKIKHKHNKVTHQHAHTWSGFPCKNTGVVGWCGKPEAAQEKQEKKKRVKRNGGTWRAKNEERSRSLGPL